jgi:hypothetical protein
MPYQLCNHTRVTNTKLTLLSTALSVTLEYAKPTTDRPTLGKRSEIRRPKQGFGVLSKEVARKLYLPRIRNTELIGIRLIKYNF